MIICICQNIRTRDLEACRARGLTLDQAAAELGLGANCGACLSDASALLAPAPRQPKAPQAA